MTDVRLTAINPADSSVVPVACNDKGELKLEDPIPFDGNLDGNLNVTGSITGGSTALDGNLNVTGTVTAVGRTDIGSSSLDDDVALKLVNNDSSAATLYVQNFNNSGDLFSGRNANNDETSRIGADGSIDAAGNAVFRLDSTYSTTIANNGSIALYGSGGLKTYLDNDGSITAAGGSFQIDGAGVVQTNIKSAGLLQLDSSGSFASPKITLSSVDGSITADGGVQSNFLFAKALDKTGLNDISRWDSGSGLEVITFKANGTADFKGSVSIGDADQVLAGATGIYMKDTGSASSGNFNLKLDPNGTATFANGKAGFTSEGFFWCTTRGGDTVILDAISSSGSATWAPYSQTSRAEQIKDRIKEAISPVPSQELPEPPQIRE